MDLYPSIEDKSFQFLIAQKLELRNLRNPDGLYDHQEFVRRFMSPYTPYRSLILFHHLGSGKSIACIAVAVDHYLHDGKRCVIVTKGESGTDNFSEQIRRYRKMSSRRHEWDESIFSMKHYISLSNQIMAMSDEDLVSSYSSKILVLDEAHNVRYYPDLGSEEKNVYGCILRLLRTCANTRVIMATATPMTDNSDQLMSLLGMCNYFREPINNLAGIISYNPFIRNKPYSVYMGTDGLIPDLPVYASRMIDHQSRVYSREVARGIPKDIYRSLTHISLFCFEDGTYGRGLIASKMRKTKHARMITPISTGKTREIRYVKYSVIPDLVHHLSGDGLRSSSSKYSALIATLEMSEGNAFVFVEEVRGSGLLLLACVLERHGYELYVGEDPSKLVPKKRYTLCVGSTDISPNNTERLDGFNSELNKHGDYVRVLLGSKVIGESITLLNVRQFHCITPHWNDSTINQAVGRVVRDGSHTALLPEERRVDIYIHASVLQERPESSIDIIKLQICQKKQADIQRVEKTMIDYAVDRYCLINKSAVAATDFRTFSAAYIQHHISDIIKLISPLGNIDLLSDNANIPPIICNEAICRIITSNTQVADGLYLRAYGNTVFTVKDPSLPYVTLPPLGAVKPSAEREVNTFPEDFLVGSTRCEVVGIFRFMPVKKKIELLEHCITNGLSYILKHIGTVYARIGDVVYHLLWYRDLESSYTSSKPVPRRPGGKTRAFYNGVWRTLKVHEEQEVLDSYRDLVNNLMDHVDECPVYGIISVIDGDMRLRLRNIEDFNMSVKDRRYVRRGKNIKSIKKADLAHISAFVDNIAGKPESNSSGPISSIIKHIDSVVVGMGMYAII